MLLLLSLRVSTFCRPPQTWVQTLMQHTYYLAVGYVSKYQTFVAVYNQSKMSWCALYLHKIYRLQAQHKQIATVLWSPLHRILILALKTKLETNFKNLQKLPSHWIWLVNFVFSSSKGKCFYHDRIKCLFCSMMTYDYLFAYFIGTIFDSLVL